MLLPAPQAVYTQTAPWTGIAGKPAGSADNVDNDSGGDITGVAAGTGHSGGGTAGGVVLNVDYPTVAANHTHFGQFWTGGVADGLQIVNSGDTGVSSQAARVGPDMMNVYNGNVVTDGDGYATVELPEWFEALNRDFRYQLTVLDEADSAAFVQVKLVRKIAGNRFTIRTSAPGVEVSWLVTGVRRDAYAETHRIPVEEMKPEVDRGTRLHPEDFGLPPESRTTFGFPRERPAPVAVPTPAR